MRKRDVYVFIEVVVIFSVLITVGNFVIKTDPLFFYVEFSPTILASVLIALIHGFVGSIPWAVLLSVSSFVFYEAPPTKQLLWNILILLIASEFKYYWERKLKESLSEKEYLEEKLDRLKKELLLLKVSHDKLELSYVVKPYSIRNAITDLKKELIKKANDQAAFNKFLSILAKSFDVISAGIYEYKKGKYYLVDYLGGEFEEVLKEEPVFEEAIKNGESFYITFEDLEEDLQGENYYLAVFPYKGNSKTYLLVIKDMPFSNFNEEVLTAIYILFSYVAEDIEFVCGKEFSKEETGICHIEFVKELYKTRNLFKRFNIKSSIAIFSFKKLEEEDELKLLSLSRSMDTVCIIRDIGLILFLLPLTPTVNAKDFAERLQQECEFVKLEGIYDVTKINVEEYVSRKGAYT